MALNSSNGNGYKAHERRDNDGGNRIPEYHKRIFDAMIQAVVLDRLALVRGIRPGDGEEVTLIAVTKNVPGDRIEIFPVAWLMEPKDANQYGPLPSSSWDVGPDPLAAGETGEGEKNG